MKANNLSIIGSGDKAISIGEESQFDIFGIAINKAKVGVASKDNSMVKIENMLLENSEIGFAAFQKKSEFGPGSIEVKGISFNNINKKYILEPKSKLIINDKIYQQNTKDIKFILY